MRNHLLRGRRFTIVAAIAMSALVAAILRQARGATAIEYAFVASLISIAIYTVAVTVGSDLTATFNSVATKL